MKQYTSMDLLRLLAAPAAAVILGLVLLFSPDTASALVGTLLGWCALLTALCLGAGACFGSPTGRNNRIIWAVICLFGGLWLLRNPLTVVEFLGRVLGITLMIRGGRATVDHIRCGKGVQVLSRDLIRGAATLILGCILAVLPMAGSRIFFKIIGLLAIGLGAADGFDRLRGKRRLEKGDDPNIIDVEKL